LRARTIGYRADEDEDALTMEAVLSSNRAAGKNVQAAKKRSTVDRRKRGTNQAKEPQPSSSTSRKSTQGRSVPSGEEEWAEVNDDGDVEVPEASTSPNNRSTHSNVEENGADSVPAVDEPVNESSKFGLERAMMNTPRVISKKDGKEDVVRLQLHLARMRIRDTDVSTRHYLVTFRNFIFQFAFFLFRLRIAWITAINYFTTGQCSCVPHQGSFQ
jgi:hypothetical protein